MTHEPREDWWSELEHDLIDCLAVEGKVRIALVESPR